MTFSESWESASRTERFAFAAVAVASCFSLFFSIAGFPAVGDDSNVHFNWLEQFSRYVYHGDLYPRWLGDSNCGFGAATFYFYPPLPYWFASLLRYAIPFVPSPFFNLVTLTATAIGLWTTRLLLRQYSARPIVAWTATLAYSFIAYRFADAFVRDALGEHWALAFLPLIFVSTSDRLKTILIRTIGWCGVILSSIPILIIACASVVIFAIVRRDRQGSVADAFSLMIGLAMSAVYLLPAITMRGLIHTEHLLLDHPRTTGFALLDLFLFPGQLRFLASITLVCAALFFLKQLRAGTDREWTWLIAAFVLLQIPIFWSLWHAPGLRDYLQFSWRLNGVLLLALAILYARGQDSLRDLGMIALALVTLFAEVRLSKEFVTHPQLAFDVYRQDAPQYTPIWASGNADEVRAMCRSHFSDPPATVLGLTSLDDSIGLRSFSATGRTFRVSLHAATPVRFHVFYWPYWKLTRTNEEIALHPDPNGFANATLPAGQYDIQLQLTTSRAEIIGRWISIIGLLALAMVAYRRTTSR